ncbi:MAG: TolC family protein [Dysgonamonadaceae bacterium]
MKAKLSLLVACCSILTVFAEEKTHIKLTPSQVESIFLKENLQLIAEKMNIGIAEAEIIQAKLWPNPTLSLGNINVWQSSGHSDDGAVVVPPLWGSFGRNRQFSVELSQLIQTANKRGKLIARERASREIAQQQFVCLLQGLKLELRKSIREIVYLQQNQAVLEKECSTLQLLVEAYKKLEANGHISKVELMRLRAQVLAVENDVNENQTMLFDRYKELNVLLSGDPSVRIVLIEESGPLQSPDSLSLSRLFQLASENRSDVKMGKLQIAFLEKSLAYEKAHRIPDITLSASYDRAGGVWRDFVGFGVSFDLPLFHRNQGAIKAASIAREQSIYLYQQQQNRVQHEIVQALENYSRMYRFYQKISQDASLLDLDSMLESYTRNLLQRHISMVEFIDFLETYKNNKQAVLNAKKNMYLQQEELWYAVGTELE